MRMGLVFAGLLVISAMAMVMYEFQIVSYTLLVFQLIYIYCVI